jgi:hypothetical protein
MPAIVRIADTPTSFTRDAYPVPAFVTPPAMPFPPVHALSTFPAVGCGVLRRPRVATERKPGETVFRENETIEFLREGKFLLWPIRTGEDGLRALVHTVKLTSHEAALLVLREHTLCQVHCSNSFCRQPSGKAGVWSDGRVAFAKDLLKLCEWVGAGSIATTNVRASRTPLPASAGPVAWAFFGTKLAATFQVIEIGRRRISLDSRFGLEFDLGDVS